MIRRPPRSTLSSSSAASDVYKRQVRALHQHLARLGEHTDLRVDLLVEELGPHARVLASQPGDLLLHEQSVSREQPGDLVGIPHEQALPAVGLLLEPGVTCLL